MALPRALPLLFVFSALSAYAGIIDSAQAIDIGEMNDYNLGESLSGDTLFGYPLTTSAQWANTATFNLLNLTTINPGAITALQLTAFDVSSRFLAGATTTVALCNVSIAAGTNTSGASCAVNGAQIAALTNLWNLTGTHNFHLAFVDNGSGVTFDQDAMVTARICDANGCDGPPVTSGVPEPTTLSLIGFGALALGLKRLKR